MSITGLFEGQSPLRYDATNPVILFLFQIVIILITSHLVHIIFSKLYQPRVVSEIVGGLILGPSVLGHVPRYMDTLFPTASMPVFVNAATVGLIFLMFLVGLETDVRVVRKHWRSATVVAGVGMVVPFGLGAAVAVGLYKYVEETKEEDGVGFGVFVLFVGLAMAITAFPVLARILMELELFVSPVGLVALSAGVANDVVGWTLLAVSVALAQAGSGILAIYMLLCCVGWALLMVYGVRPLLRRFVRASLAEDSSPAETHLAAVAVVVLISALFTGMIGIHPIFGAFLAGAVVPKDGGFHEKLATRFSPIVYNVLLPPFFALSGINTNISGLKTGVAWGFVVATIVIAFIGKVAGGFIAAKCCRIKTRESLTIGVLLSCKGIVELIALNIGLQAGIISQETFTIFVVMAVILTGVTQPLVRWLFPVSLRDSNGQIYYEKSEQVLVRSSRSSFTQELPQARHVIPEKPGMIAGASETC